jgi:hypothetical protein
MSREGRFAVLLLAAATLAACASDDDVGFTQAPPGASSGGSTAQPDGDGDAGATSAGGSDGGGTTGGNGGGGGTNSKGGSSGSGGTTSMGGSGGTTSVGGSSGSGGTTSQGGSGGTAGKGGSGGTAGKGGSGGTAGKGGSGGTAGKGGTSGSAGVGGTGGSGGTGTAGGSGAGGSQQGCQNTWLPIPALAVDGTVADVLAVTYADDVVYATYLRAGDASFVDAAYFGRGASDWTVVPATNALLTDPKVSGYAPAYGARGLFLVEGKLVYAYNVNYPAFDSPRATTFDLTTKTWAKTPGAFSTEAGASVAVGARTMASFGGLFGELYDAGPCYDTATTTSVDLVTGKTTGGQSSSLGEREDAFGTYVDGQFFFFGGQKRQYRSSCKFPEDKPKTIATGAFFDPAGGAWGTVLQSDDFTQNPVALVASADRAVLVGEGEKVCTAKAGATTLDCFTPKGSPINYYPPYSRHTHFGVADGVFEFFWEGASAHFLDLGTQERRLLCPAPTPLATYPDSSSPPRFSAGEGRKGAVYAKAGGYFVTF